MDVEVDPYNQDGLISVHDHGFMTDARFVEAYKRGIVAAGQDYQWHWRVHIGLWAAQTAARLPGDFIECGVNKGFLSSSIMQLLDWEDLGKQFYLLDTFRGIDDRYLTEDELRSGAVQKKPGTDRAWLLHHRIRVRPQEFFPMAERENHRGGNSGNAGSGTSRENRLSAYRPELRRAGDRRHNPLLGPAGYRCGCPARRLCLLRIPEPEDRVRRVLPTNGRADRLAADGPGPSPEDLENTIGQIQFNEPTEP